jgi:hypothetical protein
MVACTWSVWTEELDKLSEAKDAQRHPIGTIIYTFVDDALTPRRQDAVSAPGLSLASLFQNQEP